MKQLNNYLILVFAMVLLALGAGCSRNGEETSLQPSQSAGKSSPQLINVAEAERLIAAKQVVVLDIRTPEEFAAGHIAGATNINFSSPDFAKAISGLNTNKTYLLHCASGNRSTQALKTFKKLKFPSLYHLDGGIKAWEKAGLPVEK